MNLKQHNDIVQKLLAQLQQKQKQLVQINKQVVKQQKQLLLLEGKPSGLKSSSSVQVQKQVQKRITQLQKQHTTKVNHMNQQIKTLTQQNSDLKERLALKSNMQQKQKDHIVEVMKKNFDRKPGSQYDHKVSALISHYEEEVSKKNNYIQTLKRQIKSLNINGGEVNNSKNNLQTKTSIHSSKYDQDQNIDNNSEESPLKQGNYSIPILEHKEQISKLQVQSNKYKSSLEQKLLQLKSLRQQYNQLTKEYYRIVNEYGVSTQFGKTNKQDKKNVVSKQILNNKFIKKSSQNKNPVYPSSSSMLSYTLSEDETDNRGYKNPLGNLLEDVLTQDQASVSVDFEEKFKKFNNRPKIGSQEEQNQYQNDFINNNNKQTHYKTTTSSKNLTTNNLKNSSHSTHNNQHDQFQEQTLLDEIMQALHVNNKHQILPNLLNLTTKFSQFQLYDNILKSLHSFFYKYGMGKVAKVDMLEVLDSFGQKYNKLLQGNQILDEICIQIGAKRNKAIDRIHEYKRVQKQMLQKMRSVDFLTQLNRSNKVMEFIQFFQLDRSQLQLPQQLKNIYQQLKYVDKFVRQANMTLNNQTINSKGLESTLELILRKLERYYEWEVELEKENQKKKQKRSKKQKQVVE